MPRNGSGVFSLPAGSTVANGDTSDASDINTPLADIEADMNTPRPVVAGGTGVSSVSAFKTAFDLEVGTDLQAYDAGLQQIADLADPNADRVLFWDDSASAYTYLTVGTNLTLSGTTLSADAQTPADGSITFAKLAGAAVVTASETIASNDNDTTVPTSAAVKDYADSVGRVLLASKTASASATLDFTEFNNALYSRYLFEIEDILPATNATALRCRVSTNGGSTYDSGVSDYAFVNEDYQGAGSASGNSAAQDYMEIVRAAASNSAGIGGICVDMHVVNAANASARTKFHGTGGYYLSAPAQAAVRFFGQRLTAQDTDAIRFFFSAGNIASGRIRMYGVV